MSDEKELIPFEATPLRGERLLVLAPHPDDEVIGCGGLLAQHLAEHRITRIVVFTDGTAAEGVDDPAVYREIRENEVRRGLQQLGGTPDLEFLRIPDRHLEEHRTAAGESIRAILQEFRPDLIVLPSPVEIHPDHRALSRAFFDVIHSSRDLEGSLALCNVAFCEISRPFQPNTLVDISAVSARKSDAIRAHESQLRIRNYDRYASGLNHYRAMTLEPETVAAEAFFVIPAPQLRTICWSDLEKRIGGTMPVESAAGELPVSVVVRTRDRLNLLDEALHSIFQGMPPARVVVVNDGGASPRDVVAPFGERVVLVDDPRSSGRSLAMNRGVERVETPWLAFLDDDDAYYPEHLSTLTRAMQSGPHRAVYSDAVSVFLRPGEKGIHEVRDRLRLFSRDFDRTMLAVDNYIPLPTLLVATEDFRSLGGFDPEFDLFEDWDFILRLSRLGSFGHVPLVTCEIRHFEGSGSAVLASPEGSEAFRRAKLRIWEKHRDLASPEAFADALAKQKLELQRTWSERVEQIGRGRHLERDVDRLEREKQTLIEEIREQHGRFLSAEAQRQRLDEVRLGLEAEVMRATGDAQRLARELETNKAAVASQSETIGQLFAEVERLNALMETIYRSRTWKIHSAVERLKGKR
ncbi:MAG: PIG-L family deacetylase [Thermoanaerobaculia bacterium]